jgi:hypothetical protein
MCRMAPVSGPFFYSVFLKFEAKEKVSEEAVYFWSHRSPLTFFYAIFSMLFFV